MSLSVLKQHHYWAAQLEVNLTGFLPSNRHFRTGTRFTALADSMWEMDLEPVLQYFADLRAGIEAPEEPILALPSWRTEEVVDFHVFSENFENPSHLLPGTRYALTWKNRKSNAWGGLRYLVSHRRNDAS